MRILIACEYSGRVREAFRKLGHDAWSCDLLPADDNSPYHIQGDVLEVLNNGWDMMIAHPPCTYLSNSGVQYLHSRDGRWELMREGAKFFRALLDAPIPLKAIENPIMHKYAVEIIGRRQDQVVHPWMFGEDASKGTCLWLVGLPKLVPTQIIKKRRYANQTPGGHNKFGPSPDRWKLRSLTFQGIADAMAEQWSAL